MWQSPAIFLQQAISDCVIWWFGRQASKGAAVHTASKHRTTIARTLAMD